MIRAAECVCNGANGAWTGRSPSSSACGLDVWPGGRQSLPTMLQGQCQSFIVVWREQRDLGQGPLLRKHQIQALDCVMSFANRIRFKTLDKVHFVEGRRRLNSQDPSPRLNFDR